MRRHLFLSLTLLAACYGPEDGAAPSSASLHPDRVDHEYVLGLGDAATETDLDALVSECGLELLQWRPEDRIAVVLDPLGRDERQVIEEVEAPGVLAFAEPQFLYFASHRPDDWGEYLWGMHNTGIDGGRSGADIGAFDAWDVGAGEGVIVAVIDTGIDGSHPDLAPNLWTNPGEVAGNGVDDDGNGYVDDVHGWNFVHRDNDPDDRDGHGTHVSGTIAARGDDGQGVVGVAYRARVMPLKFLEGDLGGSASSAAEAIRYAVRNGARVINASWGGPGSSTAIRNAIATARAQGVLFVTAAGNEGANNDSTPSYPANYPLDNILSVAASDRGDRLAAFSNRGRNSVDLAAPGEAIVSTWPGGDWTYLDGTSMASPMVAGAAALIWGARGSLSYTALRDALIGGVEPLQSGGGSIISGGRLDLAGSLALLGLVGDEDSDGEPPAEPPPATPAAWTFVPFPVQSAHPYVNDYGGRVGIEAPQGAVEVVLHFDRVDVEANYDFVRARTEDGTVLAQWTGSHNTAFDSAVLPASAFDLWLQTDGSITGWGLAIRGFSWR